MDCWPQLLLSWLLALMDLTLSMGQCLLLVKSAGLGEAPGREEDVGGRKCERSVGLPRPTLCSTLSLVRVELKRFPNPSFAPLNEHEIYSHSTTQISTSSHVNVKFQWSIILAIIKKLTIIVHCPIRGVAKIRPGQVSSKIMLFPPEHSRELQINTSSESAVWGSSQSKV